MLERCYWSNKGELPIGEEIDLQARDGSLNQPHVKMYGYAYGGSAVGSLGVNTDAFCLGL